MKKHQRDAQGKAIKWRDSRFAAKARRNYAVQYFIYSTSTAAAVARGFSDFRAIVASQGQSAEKIAAIAARKVALNDELIALTDKYKPEPLPNM